MGSLVNALKLDPQTRKVLAHLSSGQDINPLLALNAYGVMRLAARIHELRKAGYSIETRREKRGDHTVAVYAMAA
jgi:Helix-turn-helix domain